MIVDSLKNLIEKGSNIEIIEPTFPLMEK